MHKSKKVAIVLTILAMAGTAQAQDAAPNGTNDGPLAPLYACASITDNVARLACYDAAVGRIQQSEQAGDVVAIDRQQVEQVRREAFGFHLPSLPRFGRRGAAAVMTAAPDEAQAPQSFTIVRTGRQDNRMTIITESGQTWVLLDPPSMSPPRRVPFQVVISPASLGSFIMRVEGTNRGYRVRRVE